jgi:hypothetical protein
MNPTKPKALAIVWAPEEQRTESMARRLGISLHHVHFLQYKRPLYAPFKYPLQWMKTWQILFRERPDFVYVTNPPPFAPLCVYLYTLVSRAKMVLDTHPPSLFMKKWAWSVPLQRWLIKRAYANVTDQSRFARIYNSWGVKSETVVLERPPKDVGGKNLTRQPDPNAFEITVVNTFAEDEPLDCVLEAARLLPDVKFYITGDTSKGDKAMIEGAPSNCTFTGYLLGDAYWDSLQGSRAVMTLTNWKHSLIMAGQDGIVMHKPVIMSRQETTTEYFYKGTVFVDNTGPSIAQGIRDVQSREQALIKETYEFLEERQQAWDMNFKRLVAVMQN